MFWDNNWACLRTAGSGSTSLPAPDLLVSNAKRILAIECKSGKTQNKYIDETQVNELKTFARMFNAEAWVGARFNARGWYFIKADNLKRSGKNYVVSFSEAENSGISFEQLVNEM